MDPDPDIVEVEKRLARRRLEIEQLAHESGRRALKSLTSPAVMIGVVALGFLAGAGVTRKRPIVRDRRSGEVKKTGVTGLLMTAGLWLLKQQLGNPTQIAQLVLSKVNDFRAAKAAKKAAPRSSQSPYGDRPLYR